MGYTSKPTLRERMAYGDSGDDKLIDHQFFFTFREDAWDVEQTLLEHFDRHRAFGKFSNDPMMPLGGRGQSELFAIDVLGLDDKLYEQSEKETLDAIKANNEQASEGCFMVLIGLILAPFTLGLSLLVIFGGFSGIFSRDQPSVRRSKTRPVHPQTIQKLVDSLNSSQKSASLVVSPS